MPHYAIPGRLVPRAVHESMANQIVLNEALSLDLVAHDRSFVYSRVQAFKVKKA